MKKRGTNAFHNIEAKIIEDLLQKREQLFTFSFKANSIESRKATTTKKHGDCKCRKTFNNLLM